MSNFDKHRLIHVSGAVINAATYWMSNWPGLGEDFQPVRFGPFEDGAVVAAWPFDTDTEPEMDVPLGLRFDIAFDQEGPGRGQPVVAALQRIERHIGNHPLARLGPWLLG